MIERQPKHRWRAVRIAFQSNNTQTVKAWIRRISDDLERAGDFAQLSVKSTYCRTIDPLIAVNVLLKKNLATFFFIILRLFKLKILHVLLL